MAATSSQPQRHKHRASERSHRSKTFTGRLGGRKYPLPDVPNRNVTCWMDYRFSGGSDGTRTRSFLRDRRSNHLNYAPAYKRSSDSFRFPPTPSRTIWRCRDRAAFRRQQEVRFSRQRVPQTRRSSPPVQTRKLACIASNLSKGLAQAPGINFSRYIIIH